MKYLSALVYSTLLFPLTVTASILFDNGPMITHPGGGSGGADVSALHSGMDTLGYGMQSTPRRVADNFTVPLGPGWDIATLVMYGYQDDSTTGTSTFTTATLRIWDGAPGAGGSSVIWGDDSTNVLAASVWSGIYRTNSSNLASVTRPIFANTLTVGTYLAPGEYWMDWAATGSLASGPWAPPIDILGNTTTGDALRFSGSLSAWVAVDDDGTLTLQGLPFIVNGEVAAPEPGTSLLMAAGIVLGIAARRRRA